MPDTAARKRRQYGAYYTERSPFDLRPFQEWAELASLGDCTVLEPFAGSNNIVRMLQDAGLCTRFDCYDIAAGSGPADAEAAPGAADGVRITRRDTLRSFPAGYRACVTNPPWLARNSAHRRNLDFDVPDRHDDVYKYALELALENCDYVAFIIPATFLRSGLFRSRLESFVLLEKRPLFADTDNPVCLALFAPSASAAVRRARVWADDVFLGYLDELERRYDIRTRTPSRMRIRFNSPGGMLGLWGVDNTREESIRFCHGSEMSHRTVKQTDRSITRIDPAGARVTPHMIDGLNALLGEFRRETRDVFLAPFKGLRSDGRYRRRLDYAAARGLISRYLHRRRNGRGSLSGR